MLRWLLGFRTLKFHAILFWQLFETAKILRIICSANDGVQYKIWSQFDRIYTKSDLASWFNIYIEAWFMSCFGPEHSLVRLHAIMNICNVYHQDRSCIHTVAAAVALVLTTLLLLWFLFSILPMFTIETGNRKPTWYYHPAKRKKERKCIPRFNMYIVNSYGCASLRIFNP